MKKLLPILLLLVTVNVQAQNWQEWTRQKRTQIKYLVEQIAALDVYAAFVEKGYDIAKNGLNAIGKIKKGDFSIHEEYFSSLRNVNPKIKSYWKVGGIIDLQLKIVQICHQQIKYLRNSSQLTSAEFNYCKKVTDGVLKNCREILGRLMGNNRWRSFLKG